MKKFNPLALFLLSVILLLTFSHAFPTEVFSQEKGTANPNLLSEAENLYRAHRYEDALQRYEQFLRTSPPAQQWHYAFLRTAELYGIRGDWNQARVRYERLLTMKTDSGIALRARYGAGQANYKLGNLSGSRADSGKSQCFQSSRRTAFQDQCPANGIISASREHSSGLQPSAPGGKRSFLWRRRMVPGSQNPLTHPGPTPLDLEKLADLYRDTPLAAGDTAAVG